MPCWSSGSTNVAPAIMPRMPMKRVSRPTRMACSATSTNAKPRLSEPSSWRIVPATIEPDPIASSASEFVASSREPGALDDAHDADDRGADRVGHGADRDRDQRDLREAAAARPRGAVEVGEHDEDQQRAERRQHRPGDVRELVVADVLQLPDRAARRGCRVPAARSPSASLMSTTSSSRSGSRPKTMPLTTAPASVGPPRARRTTAARVRAASLASRVSPRAWRASWVRPSGARSLGSAAGRERVASPDDGDPRHHDPDRRHGGAAHAGPRGGRDHARAQRRRRRASAPRTGRPSGSSPTATSP